MSAKAPTNRQREVLSVLANDGAEIRKSASTSRWLLPLMKGAFVAAIPAGTVVGLLNRGWIESSGECRYAISSDGREVLEKTGAV